MNITVFQDAISTEHFRITDHAVDEMAADSLKLDDVLAATFAGEIIESYPADYPLPSCLILGFVSPQEPIHAVWAYNPNSKQAVLVTVYRPDFKRWTNWRTRKEQT